MGIKIKVKLFGNICQEVGEKIFRLDLEKNNISEALRLISERLDLKKGGDLSKMIREGNCLILLNGKNYMSGTDVKLKNNDLISIISNIPSGG